jgi:ferredoxin-type protein NapH
MSHANFKLAQEAIEAKGWWQSHRFLVLRRLSQLTILLLFLVGPWFGWWLVKGNLNYSLTLDVLPLADPLVLLQSLLARHVPERNAIIGVCWCWPFMGWWAGACIARGCARSTWSPMRPVRCAASWDIRGGGDLPRETRYWLLGLILAAGGHHRHHRLGAGQPGVDAAARADVWHGCGLAADWRHLPV